MSVSARLLWYWIGSRCHGFRPGDRIAQITSLSIHYYRSVKDITKLRMKIHSRLKLWPTLPTDGRGQCCGEYLTPWAMPVFFSVGLIPFDIDILCVVRVMLPLLSGSHFSTIGSALRDARCSPPGEYCVLVANVTFASTHKSKRRT